MHPHLISPVAPKICAIAAPQASPSCGLIKLIWCFCSQSLSSSHIFFLESKPGLVASISQFICCVLVVLFNLLHSLLLVVIWKMGPWTWVIQGECFPKISKSVISGPLFCLDKQRIRAGCRVFPQIKSLLPTSPRKHFKYYGERRATANLEGNDLERPYF